MKKLKWILTLITALVTIAILIIVFFDELKHDYDKLTSSPPIKIKAIELEIPIRDVAVIADFDKGAKAAQSGDFKTALAKWAPLAEQGHAGAQSNLGVMYASGQGVPQDHRTAVEWYTKAAQQGYAAAQHNLGVMYAHGKGVPENDKIAVKWYTKAAEQGHGNAQHNLGVMYDKGYGVPENDKVAVKWYTKAAEQGYASAQTNLGIMYNNGHGVVTDYVRAYMWFNLGAYNGNTLGSQNKASITQDMTSAQITKAQEMSSRCLESNYSDC